MSFIKKLENLMELAGKSKADIARGTGIPAQTIYSWWRNSDTRPSTAYLRALTVYFRVHDEYFNDFRSFCDKLSLILVKKDLTVKKLAEGINVPLTIINGWFETGSLPSDEEYSNLLTFLNIKRGVLFSSNDEGLVFRKRSTQSVFGPIPPLNNDPEINEPPNNQDEEKDLLEKERYLSDITAKLVKMDISTVRMIAVQVNALFETIQS